MAINKVIYGGNTLIDLTADTVTAEDVASGKKFHLADGTISTGTSTKDSDTQDATATAAEILATKTAYVKGSKVTGSMANNGAIDLHISTVAGEAIVPQGYHDGSGKVTIDATEQAKIIPANIRKDIQILGVTGTMSGDEDVHAQAKTVTPSTSQQVVVPDTDYNYLTQVTVEAITYTETDNAAGGKTVTIAG